MVSLINFKTVDEDLSESRRPVEEATGRRASPLTDRSLHEAGQPDGARVQPNAGGRLDVSRPERTYAIEVQKQQHNQHQQRRQPETASQEQLEANGRSNTSSNESVSDEANLHDANRLVAVPFPAVCLNGYDYYGCGPVESNNNSRSQNKQQVVGSTEACCSCGCDYGRPGYNASARDKCPASCGQASFTVTWRRLKFCIEPKWHERIACGSSALFALASRASASMSLSSTSTSASKQSPTAKTSPAECQQTQASAQQPQVPTATRVVLDQLDGSFRSGELTAILGPSGAGKTTLLDCLTGHRKQGLSGSVRFSSSSFVEPGSPGATATVPSRTGGCQANDGQLDCCYSLHNDGEQLHSNNQNNIQTPKPKHLMHLAHTGRFSKQAADGACPGRKSPAQPLASEQATMNGDNLKVSIIPQNDHLIGHLTVYETLNYASKMKNCFEGQFDHKLNVRRVAQQLGLMSCLATRINKLSGGQYKRVSIAQELLSSPDVLILDEPTSGLDAMTCYQTVQVLKQLTDGCQASGQKPIAVILTIHQPNSDVFQQFNHVYVVAQGGKCIYEGPPGNIESVINRVGICLPNSYYNPATMIVEIAAGKFGQAAILKLNTIQKKQYSQQRTVAADEQNSTGDSAVDCPSSNYEDEDDDDDENDADDADDDLGGDANHMQQHRLKDSNPHKLASEQAKGGAINAGFTMEGELDKDANNNIDQDRKHAVKTSDTCFVAGAEFAPVVGSNNKLYGSACVVGAGEKQDRRKRRRRMRRRTGETMTTTMTTSTNVDLSSGGLLDANTILVGSTKSKPSSAVRILMNAGSGGGGGGGDGDSGTGSDAGGGHSGRSEKRLKLNSLKTDQKFPFWRHTYLHFHRSWLSIVRDPMLCSMQLALHIIVPVMVSLVYGTDVGKPNACPRAGPIDIMAYALEPIDTALQLQEDLRTTLENIGYIFFKLYGIIFAAMTVTVLTFPLDMHVLVKEFRNGWYGLSSYFLGRTLADIPFQLTLPLLAMSLSYYATGQPYSYFQWRFFSITAILILSSLIAQSQGLLFGAILMDKMKAAVFVAPAATTPIILFAGFLVRTQSIPSYLRPLSNLSYLRYAIEACLISRYGFNQCECDPAIFNQTVPELPPIARSMLDYWLSSFKPTELTSVNGTQLDSVSTGTSLSPSSDSIDSASKPDLFTKLIDSLSRANSFGRNITSCEQVVPYPMIDYDLKDEQLVTCFAILLAMLLFTRLLTFFIVCFKVKRKV